MRSLSMLNTSPSSSNLGIGDTLRDDGLDDRELVFGFLTRLKVDPVRFDSLSDKPDFDLEDEVDEDFFFFDSGFSTMEDSFCFLFVGRL